MKKIFKPHPDGIFFLKSVMSAEMLKDQWVTEMDG